MHILVSNDDGIHAPGLTALRRALADRHDVHVVAPRLEQSAVGHSITIFDPLKVTRVDLDDGQTGHAVQGSPADCVKLAASELLPDRPELVLSGINLGPNTGISVLYSGTVSAASEAAILGIPSAALSLATFTDPHWDTARLVAGRVADILDRHKPPSGTLLNINIPNVPPDKLRGYAVTRQAHSRFIEEFHRRTDPRGNTYYWLAGEMELLDDRGGTDVEAVRDGYVSVTPIGLDLTHHALMDEVERWGFSGR